MIKILLITFLLFPSVSFASILFNGTNQYLGTSNFDSTVSGQKQLTMHAVIDIPSGAPSSTYLKIFGKTPGSGNQAFNFGVQDCSYYSGTTGKLCMSIGLDNSSQNTYVVVGLKNSTVSLTGKNWVDIVWNNTSGTAAGDFTFYINGVAQSTSNNTLWTNVGSGYSSSTTLNDGSGGQFTLAAACGGTCPGAFFNGNISEAAVWKSALTSSNITTLYHGGTSSPCSRIPSTIGSPIIYLPLDDNSNGTVSSSPSNSGSISMSFTTFGNSPTWSSDLECAPSTHVWYVRDGGSNPTNCTGLTNAVYPGSGTGVACAFSNPMYVLGAGCGNYGGGSCTINSIMSSGDTLYIVGDSDTNPGNQAQYEIGAGVITSSGNCSSGINCTMANPPGGSSSSAMTSIIGIGTHRPQLWGTQGVNQVLEADASYLLVNNLEITDHSSCIYGFPTSGTVDGFPLQCVSNSGNWAKEGIFYGGTGSEIENLWVHGIAHDGTDSDNLSGFTSYNNVISGNAFNGDAPGNIYSGSTVDLNNVTWQNDIIVYNGCGEHYPMHSSDPYDTANYHNCYDDNNSGQGDGLGNQANSAVCTGTLEFINDDVSFNTQDGLDFLHCEGDGNFYMYRTRTEGNEGQQVKFNGAQANIENSLIMGDCYYFYGQSFTYMTGASPDVCRAGGEAINMVFNGGTYAIDNSTVLATGPGIQDAGASAACSGTLQWYNDNVIGGYNTPQYGNNALATWIDQECTSGSVTLQEDYNHVWNVSASGPQCGSTPGTHDKCSDSSAAVTTTLTTSMLGPTAYYASNDLGHLMYPASAGQLPSNANNSLSLTGTSNDFNSVSRVSTTYTIGGYTLNSCVGTGGTCFESGECCTGSCVNNACPGSCLANTSSCTLNTQCCSSLCQSSLCVACFSNSYSCTSGSQCCSGICNNSMCTPAPSKAQCVIGGEHKIGGNLIL